MNKLFAGSVVALLLGGLSCGVTVPRFSFKYAERRGRIAENGLRFIVNPQAGANQVEVDVRYMVGAREDPPGKAGIAHVVEHLMFQQRPPNQEDPNAATMPMMASINDKTITFNAYTNWDTTHYMNTGLPDKLEELLVIEAQRMYLKCQTISDEEFKRELEVVRNEIRQRGGTAEGQIPQLVLSSIYPKGHAYEQMIGGNDAQLTSISLSDVCAFMDKYYTPENAVVIVSGELDTDSTIKAIYKYFHTINVETETDDKGNLIVKRGPDGKAKKILATAPRKQVEPVKISPEKQTVELDVDKPILVAAWALPPSNTPEGRAAYIGLNSTFFSVASKARQYGFATSVSPGVLGGQLAPTFYIEVKLRNEGKYDEALEFITKAARRAAAGADFASSEQIEEQQNRNKAQTIRQLEQLSARTNMLGEEVQFNDKFDFDSSREYMIDMIERDSKFDGELIVSATRRALDPAKMKLLYFKPSKTGIKGDRRANVQFSQKSHDSREFVDVDPNEARRPVKLPKDFRGLKGTKQFTLDNGMKVVLLPVNAMPIVYGSIAFSGVGKSSTPTNPGIGGKAGDLLGLPLDAEAFGAAGIDVSCESGTDSMQCSAQGVSIYTDLVIDGLERIIVAGEYSQTGIEGYQKAIREGFDDDDRENAEFQTQFAAALYGPEHSLTKIAATLPEHIKELSQDKLDSFRDKNFVASNAVLTVVGDFDPVKVEKKIRSTFGGWSKGSPLQPVAAPQFQRQGPAFIGVVTKREVPQLQVGIGYPSLPGQDGQTGAREVLAEMLTLRMGDVRFKLGATYGVYARLRNTQTGSAYMMGGTVDAPRAGEGLKAMRDGVAMLRKEETFSRTEFVRARKKVLQQKLGLSSATAELGDEIIALAMFGLAPESYNSQLQLVAASSPALLRAIIERELDPNNEVVVVKGTRAQLEKAFKDAGITDVKYVEPTK